MGAIGMCVCQYIVAITGTVAGTSDLPAQRAAIAFVCIYIFFFASSWGPVAWGKWNFLKNGVKIVRILKRLIVRLQL
jgi:hypothetical protein